MNCPIWHRPGHDRRDPAHRARPQDRRGHPLALQAVSGGTVDDGPNLYLSASFTPVSRILPLDPATGAAWTGAAVNALRAGPKVTV
jgi:hypothetical protein